ncbi:MAG: uL15m family ribosomal protein, partial [Bacteroidota bacterium]
KKLKEITPEILQSNGLADKKDVIKILGRGEISSALSVTAHKFSKSAEEAIEKAGGSTAVVGK